MGGQRLAGEARGEGGEGTGTDHGDELVVVEIGADEVLHVRVFGDGVGALCTAGDDEQVKVVLATQRGRISVVEEQRARTGVDAWGEK